MEVNYEKLKWDLSEYEQDTALLLLYQQYVDMEVEDRGKLRDVLSDLNGILEKLTLRECDRVFYLVFDLCEESEKRGFLSGLRIGAKLMQELMQ